MRRVFASLSLIAAYSRANLRSAFEYRTSFASEVLAMLVNDCMWVVFWVGFYERYPAVRGWERADVVTLWAVIATAFGIATALFGNLVRLAGIIARGELDFFLSLPRPVLLHTLIGRMSFSAYGDVVFGIAAYAWIVRPSASDWLLFTALTLSNVGIFVGFGACMASWSFWLGSAEGIAQ
ncbi:MAG TPA: ABC-2 family transporter protein, partial [Polyangiales bacterium]|nr:ABC-2 family transporter protein [Polyangiales bacterium]